MSGQMNSMQLCKSDDFQLKYFDSIHVVADFRVFKIVALRFIDLLAGFFVCQSRAWNIKRS
jgi:hypothetical protein